MKYTVNNLAKKLLVLIVAIFIANWVGGKLHLYYMLWWYDMPMHFSGGIFLGLLFTYLLLRFHKDTWSKKQLWQGLLFVFLIGFGWEIFEFSIDTFISSVQQLPMDSLSDLCFDLAGGGLSLLYSRRYFREVLIDLQK